MHNKISIYIAAHKKFIPPSNLDTNIYIPIHCGKVLYKPEEDFNNSINAILPKLGDDTGLNISYMNPYYCELTAMYQVQQNDKDSNILGLNHYRRYFVKDENSEQVLNKNDILNILEKQNYDAIVQGPGSNEKPHYNSCSSVYEEYCHIIDDMDKALELIKYIYPNLYPIIEKEIKHNNQMCLCNMIIAKREVFMDYCQFLFTIYDKLQNIIDYKNRDSYQRRCFGFLSERLFRPFLIAKGYKFIGKNVGDPAHNDQIQ